MSEIDEVIYRVKLREYESIKKVFNKLDIHGYIGYYFDYGAKKLILYTERPGIIIGFQGKNIDILKQIIKDELCIGDFEVEFVEIKGKIIEV